MAMSVEGESAKPCIRVCAAVIVRESSVLVARRTDTGAWEFPGGKNEPGEDDVDCLKREIDEELGISIEVHSRVASLRVDEKTGCIDFQFYYAHCPEGEPLCRVHTAVRWMPPTELSNLHMHEADRTVARMIRQRIYRAPLRAEGDLGREDYSS